MATGDYHTTILGAGGVGKTCVVLRLVRDTFDVEYIPTILDEFTTQIVVDGKSYTMHINDTAGQEEMKSITDSVIDKGDSFILVYSVTSKLSFLEAQDIYKKILLIHPHPKLVLIGNKCDLGEHSVTFQDGSDLAKQWGAPFFETSAKNNTNISEAFQAVLKLQLSKTTKSPKSNTDGGCCLML